MAEWEPATEAERAMRDTLRNGDQEGYFKLLANSELLLPVSAEALAGRAPLGWGTWTTGGRTHVLAFTSPQALFASLAQHAGSYRKLNYADLASSWPNQEWWLAVDPGLPIEAYLPAWFVVQVADGEVKLPGRATPDLSHADEKLSETGTPLEEAAAALASAETPEPVRASGRARVRTPEAPPSSPEFDPASDFDPANDVERKLLAAITAGDTDTFLSTLLLAKVLLPVPAGTVDFRPGMAGFPWQTEQIDGASFLVVFTSAERLRDRRPTGHDSVTVKFTELISSWPDENWSFAINPGTPVGATLSAAQVVALANWAAEVGLTAVEGPEVAEDKARVAAARRKELPTVMQKAVPPSQVAFYLQRGYDRVSGFVHRATDVAQLNSPEKLYHALGLAYSDSPFSAIDAEVHVIRWPAFRGDLYRIPYGGQTTAAMSAMQGWVIERAPFRGNGFAPSESSEIIPEFKVDSARLPHGAEMWRIDRDGNETFVATFDADGPRWLRAGIGA